MSFHANMKGLDTPEHKEAIERRRDCADSKLVEQEALVKVIAASHDSTADHIRVAINVSAIVQQSESKY
tara:strand:- start:810 stop:1016 length:207 start_codon:yes stop_codon:yes gene_type:complete